MLRFNDITRVYFVDNVLEVEFQRFEVRMIWSRADDTLGEIEHQGGEAGGGEVDFLVVRDLADGATRGATVRALVGRVWSNREKGNGQEIDTW